MFEHSPLSDYIPHAFGPYNYISISYRSRNSAIEGRLTVIFPDIFQRESQFRIFVLDNADFSESTLPYNSSESEVVEAD